MAAWRDVRVMEPGMRLIEVAAVSDVEAAARVIAEDEREWLRTPGRVVCWLSVRMQMAAGATVAEMERMFGIWRSTITRRKCGWKDRGCERDLPRIAEVVRRAIVLRREMTGEMADAEHDDVWCRLPAPKARSGFGDAIFAAAAQRGRKADAAEAANVFREEMTPWMAGAYRRVLPGPAPGLVASEQGQVAWSEAAHAAQVAPAGAWRIWLMMGGRGAGKTRAGAEWVRALIESGEAKRIALVGPTLHDVREVMIGGPSGLLAVASEGMRPTYEISRRRLVWPKTGPCAGAVAFAFSAEDPDSLRGPQFDSAWCDEIGAWARDMETWQTLAFGMRLGEDPRIVVTTTPRPRALVKLLAEKAEAGRGGVVLTQASTRANAANLAPEFVSALEEDYGGTLVGRQELDGELIEDIPGAMFSRAQIEASRARWEDVDGFDRVVVGVDPPVGASVRSDACGIVVAGLKDGVVFVLADATVRGMRPGEWAERAVAAALAYGAGVIVAEANQGGELVREVLREAAKGRVKVKLEHARASKRDRAIPVSLQYEQGRVRHVRVLKELEDELCTFGVEQSAGPGRRARSPDRVDALVWAVLELRAKPVRPRVESL